MASSPKQASSPIGRSGFAVEPKGWLVFTVRHDPSSSEFSATISAEGLSNITSPVLFVECCRASFVAALTRCRQQRLIDAPGPKLNLH